MVSVQEWKNGVLAQTQDADHIKTAEALAELLEGSSSPADIAKIITTVYEPPPETRRDCSHAGENKKVTEFWVTHMTDAISLFGDVDTQDRLLALLVEMSKQPDVRNPDGVLKGAGGCAIYWRDLPEWEWQFSNYGLTYNHAEHHSSKGFSRKDYLNQGPGLLNLTRFAATLLARGLFTSGLAQQASDILQLGLEQPYSEENEINMKPFEWQVLVPVAATWLIEAGAVIYDHCLNDEIEDPTASGDIQAGWGGGSWTMQRWAYWKTQLQTFTERRDMNEKCRDFAAKAVRKMEKVEGQHQP